MRFIVKSLKDSKLTPCVTAGLPFAASGFKGAVESDFMLCASHSRFPEPWLLSTGGPAARSRRG